MNKNSLIAASILAAVVLPVSGHATAQDGAPRRAVVVSDRSSVDEDIKLFRKDVRSQKRQIIAANLDLTETEAQQFWPVYDRYMAEMIKIMDKKYDVLKEYGENYESLTDEQADTYVQGRTAVEESIVKLRLKYVPIFRQVLSGKKAALFTQLDWRLALIVDLQLSSQIPLVEP